MRIVEKCINERGYLSHLKEDRGDIMLFLMGARQVGKTTLSKLISKTYKEHLYLNWDIDDHRDLILSGQRFIEKIFPPERLGAKPLIIFDELHKYKNWKNFLKGFFDLYKNSYSIIVTGSAHLNVFQKGGDSMMGRYVPYTIHPFSVGELNPSPLNDILRPPFSITDSDWDALDRFGGFPSPFLHREQASYNQWKRTRRTQLFREDIRDLTHIHEISQLELFAQLLTHQSGSILNRSSYATKLQVSIQTIGRWIETLKQFYFAFSIYPWKTNIPHSLIKEPKVYLHDWSLVADQGMRFETMVACHLKKSVDFWSESGLGEFELFFLRDKQQREVDFLVTRDTVPWMLVEVKTSEQPLSPSVYYFKEHTKAPHAFQVTKNMPFVDGDCFMTDKPLIVPARTFLSQLV